MLHVIYLKEIKKKINVIFLFKCENICFISRGFAIKSIKLIKYPNILHFLYKR
jgi:hypothetical protein